MDWGATICSCKDKKSSEYFSIYLEKDPGGEFAEEAEELLEMLTMIKDANNNMDDEELERIYKIEEEAIDHLEEGIQAGN